MDRDVSSDGRRKPSDGVRPSLEQYERARAELVGYLADFGDEAGHVERLADALLARATQRWRVRPERELADIALEEAETDITAWSFFVLGQERIGEHSAALIARAAYHACGGSERWPERLLGYDLPDDFICEMRAAAPLPTPPERPGRMVMQPLETWSLSEAVSPRVWTRLIGDLAGSPRA